MIKIGVYAILNSVEVHNLASRCHACNVKIFGSATEAQLAEHYQFIGYNSNGCKLSLYIRVSVCSFQTLTDVINMRGLLRK